MDSFNNLTEEQKQAKLEATFKAADKNGNGKLELAEIQEVFKNLGIERSDDEIKANLPEGGLDLDGFKAFVASKIQERSNS